MININDEISINSKYIAIEGIDGSGKTSICNRIYELLTERGLRVEPIIQPTRDTKLGSLIRSEMLSGKINIDPMALQMLIIADRSVQSDYIESKSLDPDISYIISDRSFLSGIAAALNDGIPPGIIYNMNLNANVIFPSMIIYLDVDPDTAHERITKRSSSVDIFEDINSLKLMHDSYDRTIAFIHGEMDLPIIKIPANADINDIADMCIDYILNKFI